MSLRRGKRNVGEEKVEDGERRRRRGSEKFASLS